ncbi:MAG: class I adenylate-forming enzyme family protein [Acidimicrobiales bacterium]
MALTYEEAAAQVTAPGQIFEVVETEVLGVRHRVFAHAPVTLRALFEGARGHGGRTFLVYEDERWSFAAVMAAVDAFAAALVGRYGVKPGERVAIGMRNYPEWVVSFAAITSIGAISVSLNAWWTEEELAFALGDSAPRVLVADRERAARAAATAARLGVEVVVVRAGDGAGPPNGLPPGAARWEEVLVDGAPMPDVEVGADDDATILYTSGTTGRAKGAVSTNRAVMQALFGFACRTVIERTRKGGGAPADEGELTDMSFILIVPLFHVTGCVPVMLSCFALGLKLVMMHRWEPERALELIERERVTAFVGVPTQSWDLLESPRFHEFDTSSLRSIGGGGAPAPPALVHRVAGSFSGGTPTIGYGMTETNALGPGNSGADYLDRPTSTGRTVSIMGVSVRGPRGEELPADRSGEVWLRGPNLIRGYWNRPDATSEAFVDGWLRTGDLGHLDEEGFLYVEDRIKDMILRGGENVYSAEVESALYEHPGVHEAAVFGVPHERLGEEVAAVVVAKRGRDVGAAELQAFVGERLAAFKVPSRVRVVAEPLPRNAAGKVVKRELRERFPA